MAKIKDSKRASGTMICDENTPRQGGLGGFLRCHQVASFFFLAYALTWLAWLPPTLGYGGTLGLLGLYAGGFGPAVAAAVITWLSGGSIREWARSIFEWRIHPRWYLIAFGLPITLAGVASIVFALLGLPVDLSLIPGHLAMYLPTLVLTALFQGGNEEPGWRGFALPRLQKRYSPINSCLVLGIVWAFWHLPVLAANPETQHGATLVSLLPVVLVTAINIISLTFLFAWVYNSTKSVLICILLHASANTVNALFIPVTEAALVGDVYWKVLLVTTGINMAVAAVLVLITRGRLGYHGVQQCGYELQMQARTD